MAVEHKHTIVVHMHPHVLELVDTDVEQAVVQMFYAAAATHAVVVELVAVIA